MRVSCGLVVPWRLASAAGLLWLLTACSTPPRPAAPVAAVRTLPAPVDQAGAGLPAPAPAVQAQQVFMWDEALRRLADRLGSDFAEATRQGGPGTDAQAVQWLVGPFVHGVTGAYSMASKQMGRSMTTGWRAASAWPEPLPYTQASLAQARWMLTGGLTPLHADGTHLPSSPTWHLCAAVVDLRRGRVVATAGVVAARDGIDSRPTAFFRDAPVLAPDAATLTLDRRCELWRQGDPLPDGYRLRLMAAPFVTGGIERYNAGAFAAALRQFEQALQLPAGHQMRSFTGLYLSLRKLGRHPAALRAWRKLLEHALDQGDFSLPVFYNPGTAGLQGRRGESPRPQDRWGVLAGVLARRLVCADVVVTGGHTVQTPPDPQLARARAVQWIAQLVAAQPVLARRLRAGEDDAISADALVSVVAAPAASRSGRTAEAALIEFRTIPCY